MDLVNVPKHIVAWIYACISTAMFSIIVNSITVEYFPSRQGIRQDDPRQGDPMSAYLFLIVLKVLNQIFI